MTGALSHHAAHIRVHGTDAREDTMQGSWKETMVGGSPEAERAEFDELARDIMRVQLKNAKTASAHGVRMGSTVRSTPSPPSPRTGLS